MQSQDYYVKKPLYSPCGAIIFTPSFYCSFCSWFFSRYTRFHQKYLICDCTLVLEISLGAKPSFPPLRWRHIFLICSGLEPCCMVEGKALCNDSVILPSYFSGSWNLALSIYSIQRAMSIYRHKIPKFCSEHLKTSLNPLSLRLMEMRLLISLGTGSILNRATWNHVQFECLGLPSS